MLRHSADIPATLAALLRRYGPRSSVAVLPDGPQCIPYIK